MKELLRRPSVKFSPGDGLLRNDFFQMAYVTTDIARACRTFVKHYGVKGFRQLDGQMPSGGKVSMASAWVGGINLEIIQSSGPGTAFYNERLPSDGFTIRHHHIGYLVQDETEWQAVEQEIERGGWTVPFNTSAPGYLRALYIEAPELGHYVEYVLLERGGIEFFEGVPVS